MTDWSEGVSYLIGLPQFGGSCPLSAAECGDGSFNRPHPGATAIELRDCLACEDAATPELRRSGLFVANGSHPAKSPVGATFSASMALLRSFGFFAVRFYKYFTPTELWFF